MSEKIEPVLNKNMTIYTAYIRCRHCDKQIKSNKLSIKIPKRCPYCLNDISGPTEFGIIDQEVKEE